MLLMRKRSGREALALVEPTVDPAAPDLSGAIRSIGQQASAIGRESAEVRGLIDDTSKASERGALAVASLGVQVQDIHRAQAGIGSVSSAGLVSVERVRVAVERVGREVGDVVSTLRDVSSAAESISQIALQTRLVAFNASVEAKRAGDAGRGFGVVADAVKDLAGKVELSSKEIMRTVGVLDRRIDALAREIRLDAGQATPGAQAGQGEFHAALGEVQGAVASIIAGGRAEPHDLQRPGQPDGRDRGRDGPDRPLARRRDEAQRDLPRRLRTTDRAGRAMRHRDRGHARTSRPPWPPPIASATLLDAALADGSIGVADLFDVAYQPIPNTRPAQHLTRYVALADRLFPSVQEPVLGLSAKVVFCIAVDRNGYVATHNRAYNQPQRGDLAWDSANSRYRRIFEDRTGLASARNTRPFLLQTYRRDMGGGQFIVMKEAAAPITAAGRHWGGLRLAFKF